MNISKQLKFIYRYLITSRRWIKDQAIMVLAASLIFVAAMLWTAPVSVHGANPTPTPAQTQALTGTANPSAGPTRTPFPPEYATNSQETIGITFAGAVLVLIVVIGVIAFMPKNGEK